MDRVNVDLAAIGVALEERYSMSMIAEAAEREQPEHLRSWSRERLIVYRLALVDLSCLPYEPKLKQNLYIVALSYIMSVKLQVFSKSPLIICDHFEKEAITPFWKAVAAQYELRKTSLTEQVAHHLEFVRAAAR